MAEEQMTAEEKQRVLGIILDFYASYVPNAAPLDFKQNSTPPGRQRAILLPSF